MRTLMLSIVSVLVVGCGPMEIAVPVCQTIKQQIPGSPHGTVGSYEKSQTLDLNEQLAEYDGALTQVKLMGMTVMPREGITDFKWIESATVSLAGAPRETLVEYVRPADPSAEFRVMKLDSQAVDVLPRMQNGPVETVLEFTGELPTQDFAIDVKVCAFATVDLLAK